VFSNDVEITGGLCDATIKKDEKQCNRNTDLQKKLAMPYLQLMLDS